MELIAIFLGWLSRLVWWAAIAVAGLLILRVILNWAGANPFSRLSYNLTRLTEPLVRPMRHQFAGRITRYDLMPLLMGVMILVTGLFISGTIGEFAGISLRVGTAARLGLITARFLVSTTILLVGSLYVVAIFLRFFLPLFGISYANGFFRFLFVITEPLLKPLRRIFVAGMFDFSPLVAMFIVQILTPLVANLVGG
ncbi:MAG: YggT family protein [Acidobacteriota bacterium]